MDIKVTVILTTYNHEKYIEQTLDSVLMQEAAFGFEVVVLEDCSGDRTRDILLDYQKRAPGKIRLILAERNQCSNEPFATAFQASQSQYIAVLDGDDYWTSPHKLQKQVDFLDAHPECALCFHNVTVFYEDESREPWNHNPPGQKEISTLGDLWMECFIASCSPMFRQGLLDEFPNWYNTTFFGDWSLYILYAERGKIGYINEVMGAYRVHSGGVWSGLSDVEQLSSAISFHESLNAHLNFRYQKPINAAISKWRASLGSARAMAAESEAQLEWQRRGIDYQQLTSRIRRIVHAILPPDATAIVLSRADRELLQLEGRRAWRIDENGRRLREELFAQGEQGSQDAPWISAGATYEFRLYAGTERETVLASVAVRRSDEAQSATPLRLAPPHNAPFIVAAPNPVPAGPGQGTTTITWKTGDDLPAQVYLFVDRGQVFYPADSAAAEDQLEVLRAKGANFLFLSCKTFWWLDHYAEFKQKIELRYRVLAHQDDACLIFDLRKPADLESVRTESASIAPEAALVSVVIPCYNQAHFLKEAIGSALAQSYSHVEIIVVDDGSVDNTAEVIASHADTGVRHVRQENQGLAAARNAGLAASRGSYIVFLDADDRLLPQAIESGLACLREHPRCALAYGRYQFISASGSYWAPGTPPYFGDEHYEALLRVNFIGMGAAVIYRRAALESVGGFDTTLRACEDYDLYLRLARDLPLCGHDHPVAEYRKHDANMTEDAGLMLQSVLEVLGAQRPYICDNKRYEAAYQSGVKCWKNYYGRQLAEQVETQIQSGEWKRALSGLQTLLELCPEQPNGPQELLFAVGAQGSQAAPWINCGTIYEFRLYSGQARETLLGSVQVTRNAPGTGLPLDAASIPEPSTGTAFISAKPNPVAGGDGSGQTIVRWNTGDSVPGEVYLCVTPLDLPPPGRVRFGTLRRLAPISRTFGFDRGLPIDRHYIEKFLARNERHIRGRVLEIGNDSYAHRFGGDRVVRSNVLHLLKDQTGATIVANLERVDRIPSRTFDCVILTQNLQLYFDTRSAVRTLHRILKPGGVLLATIPGTLSQIGDEVWANRRCWGFTGLSARLLLEEAFPAGNVEVETHGNVLAAASFLYGLAAEDLKQDELDHRDPDYPVTIAMRAVKPVKTARTTGNLDDRPGEALVSVIIPCYNQARFLSEAIESVLAQSHRHFEIVVVDDGSSDRPEDVVASYSGVRCIRQANQGPSAARNVGIRASRGDYLVFLDADDRLLPEALTVGLEELNANAECAFVYGHCTFISSTGYPLFAPDARRIKEEHFVHLLEQCHIWTPGTAMFRRTVFESLAEFDPSVNPTADYDLYLRIARRFPIHGHEEVVLEYRQHGANMSNNLDAMLESVLRTLYAQLESVKGDKKCEDACRRGINLYKVYFGDPFVREARTRSALRIREIDSLLAFPISPQQRDALVQEWKDLYQWMGQVVRIVESAGAQRVNGAPEEKQCLLEIAREQNAAEREALRLRAIVKRQAEELGVLSAALAKRA